MYDRVFPFAELRDTSSYDTVSLSYLIQAYSELQRADYNYTPNDTVFDYTDIRDFVYGQNSLDTIPVLVFNADFSYIDSNALKDGRIDTLDGLFYDGAGNANSPYLTKHVTFSTLGIAGKLDSGRTYYFTWRPFYELGNHDVQVTAVHLHDLSLGETYDLSANTPVVALTF